MARAWINNLTFSDGTDLHLSKDDTVLIVGPNNAGKSATLREASDQFTHKTNANRGKVVTRIEIGQEGTGEELLAVLESISFRVTRGAEEKLEGLGYSVTPEQAKHLWANATAGLNTLRSVFVKNLTTELRLNAANSPASIDLTIQEPNHPIHALQRNDELESKFSGYFREAFGTDLIVHRGGGQKVKLYVGDRPVVEEKEDRVSYSYILKVEQLDELQEQGDGMRAFVGVLLEALVSHRWTLFIDEPEAFLHPPQARLLGKMLTKKRPSNGQMFLATHSEDFLKGILDSDTENLRVIRLRREGTVNHVKVLDNEDIQTIWRDSLLRHSNVLTGLFHSEVIICESDSDSRFFSAVLSALYDETGEIAPDVFFIHCGGKDRVPTVVNALAKLDVPMKIVVDFDVLNDTNPLRRIWESMGGNWMEIEADWRVVKTAIEQKRPSLLTTDLSEQVKKILDGTTERIFPREGRKQIESLLKKASPWTEAKQTGRNFIPNGNPTQAFDRLQATLKHRGLFILEVGEIESFVQSAGNHGPKWVASVLEKDLKNDPELEAARSFVRQLIESRPASSI